MRKKIGIAGAGLVGRLTAWELLQQGHEITLFDRDHKDGLSSAALTAAGMVSPYSEVINSESSVLDLGITSMRLWPKIISSLQKTTGKYIQYQQRGSLVISHPQDRADLDAFIDKLNRSVPNKLSAVNIIGKEQLRTLEPELTDRFSDGLYIPDEAHLDNYQLFSALEMALIKYGVVWHAQTQVESVAPYTIRTLTDKHEFDWVFDCRGFGAKSQQRELRGVRGEVIRIHAPEVNLTRPVRVMHPRYSIYIVPHADHNFVIGATSIESEDMSPITLRSSLELMSALYSVHSGFAEGHIITTPANCRPAYPDNLPKIKVHSGCISINGLYRHGYLWGPSIVEMALTCLQQSDRAAYSEMFTHPELIELI